MVASARENTKRNLSAEATNRFLSLPADHHCYTPGKINRSSGATKGQRHARANGAQEAVPPHPTDRPALAHAHPHRSQALPAEPHRAAPGKPPAEQSSAASRRAIRSGGRGFAGHRSTDRPALPHAHPHRSQALPAEPHRAAPGKPPAEQSSAASRRAIRSGGRGVAGHRSRGTRGLIRPDTTAIPTSRSL